MPSPARPHFSFPFTLTPTGSKTVEQGSTEHVEAQAAVVAYCPLGYRPERPDFGWPWPDVQLMPIDPQPLVDALNRYIDTANAVVDVDPDALANEALYTQNINIDIQVPTGGDATGTSQEAD